MRSLVPLFSDVFGLSLLKVLTPSQLKHSLCMCSWWFSWAVAVPREGLDTPSQWCLHLSPASHTGPAELPPQDCGREGLFVGHCLSWAVALGKRERMTIFLQLLHVGGGWRPPGKARNGLCHPLAQTSQWFGMAAWEPWVRQEVTGLFYKPLGKSQCIPK